VNYRISSIAAFAGNVFATVAHGKYSGGSQNFKWISIGILTHTLRHTLTLHITWKMGRLLAGSLPIASTPAPI
jgi:hypothetical protein